MQIQVRINEDGALRNQRYAFSDRFTLISELLQNARRAGATRIDVTYSPDARALEVSDDGCGIDDFQKLLTFNESGWDTATNREECPFGIGFSKCLYAATRCRVTSGRQRVDFSTEAALAKKPVDVDQIVRPTPAVIGTQVELYGIDLEGLDVRIGEICQGFPVPVTFNGTFLARPYALDHLPTTPTPIGALYLSGTRDGRHSTNTVAFLQGFRVFRSYEYEHTPFNVIHLDSPDFLARLPDRDKLIDEDRQRERIETQVRSSWSDVLEMAKRRMSAEQFVDTYYSAIRVWNHQDLLNDIDLLPSELCKRIVGYPIQERYSDQEYLDTVDTLIDRQSVERGDVVLYDIDNVTEDNAALWMLVRAKGGVIFSSHGLHKDHWVHQYVRFPEASEITVIDVEASLRTEFEGRWIWPNIVLCEAIHIEFREERVTITEDGVFHEGTLYIPAGEQSGKSVRQASDYEDEHDQFLNVQLDEDREGLDTFLRNLRSVDPAQTLLSLLAQLKLEQYPLLHGKQFALDIGETSNNHVVRLLSRDTA